MPASDYLVLPNVDTFSVVFTLGDLGRRAFDARTEEDARFAVLLLESTLADLPARMAHAQMGALGQPDLADLDYSTDFYEWAELPGKFSSLELSRQVEDFLTSGRDLAESEKDYYGFWNSLGRLRERLEDRPGYLAQGVIAEVVYRLKPFDGVPVLVTAYDRKGDGGYTLLSATAAMDVSADLRQPESLLEDLLVHGADMGELDRAWGSGEMGAVIHTGSFLAWHEAFCPPPA